MRYNLSRETTRNRYASLGLLFGVENDAEKVIEAIEKWLISVGMDTPLSSLGIDADKLEDLETYALEDPCCPLNPKKVEKGDVISILKNLI